jgi:hypothetical protein
MLLQVMDMEGELEDLKRQLRVSKSSSGGVQRPADGLDSPPSRGGQQVGA